MLSNSLVRSQDKVVAASVPPGPKGLPIVGNLFSFRRDPLAFFQQAARTYGDVAQFQLAGLTCFLLNRPEYIQDVLTTHQKNFVKGRGLERAKIFLGEGLLTSEGEFHLRQRRLMQPAFHRQRVASYGATMVDFAARASDRWQSGSERDMLQEMMEVTLAIAAKTLFDADVEAEASEIGEALTTTMQGWPRLVSPWFFLLNKLPLPSNRRIAAAQDRLNETVLRMIRERRERGEDRGDLLSMLLLAQDEEGDGTGMTDKQVRDEAMTLFLAGHETTANALTWTWYLLSQHPAVEAKLHAEITSVLNGRLPTAEDFPRLPYARMILSEAMRLYPPAWTIGRRALNDYDLPPYRIPANSMVFMSPYVTHRDARFFPNPETFDPERWTPEAQAARPKFSYYPFGGGPRQCIGEAFAWMEGVLVLAAIAQRWRLRLFPGHPVEKMPLITLRPKHGMRMIVERRVAPQGH